MGDTVWRVDQHLVALVDVELVANEPVAVCRLVVDMQPDVWGLTDTEHVFAVLDADTVECRDSRPVPLVLGGRTLLCPLSVRLACGIALLGDVFAEALHEVFGV
ncbi:hypothetical protein ACFQRB_16755 [Halobaculum litoreum]|uniref:Uncharacterized protein n=1 Tax=Halobaculum litoreum TaxID=3031998 RepID=A0ABD5XR71_9EURY